MNWESANWKHEVSQLLIREFNNFPLIHCIKKLWIVRIYYRKYLPQIEGDFFLNPRTRDFLEINMRPRISQDSELGGHELGGYLLANYCTSLSLMILSNSMHYKIMKSKVLSRRKESITCWKQNQSLIYFQEFFQLFKRMHFHSSTSLLCKDFSLIRIHHQRVKSRSNFFLEKTITNWNAQTNWHLFLGGRGVFIP